MAEAGDATGPRVTAGQRSWPPPDVPTRFLRSCGRRLTAGDDHAVWPLTRLLADEGLLDEATALMRRDADAGDIDAAAWLGPSGQDRPPTVAADEAWSRVEPHA